MNLKRTLLTALALFLLYNALLSSRVLNRFWIGPPNQWIRNDIAMQQYLYARKTPAVVITGSSLSQRLTIYRDDVHNLAFAGSSAFLGLETIERSRRYPAFVLFETNTILAGVNRELLERAFHPVLEPLRRKVFSQRSQNQPVNYLMYPMLAYYVRGKLGSMPPEEPSAQRPAQAPAAAPSGPVQRGPWAPGSVTENYRGIFAEPAEMQLLASKLKSLEELESRLAVHGTSIVYFRQPIAPELEQTRKFVAENEYLDKWLQSRAKVDHFQSGGLQFADGYHLAPAGAVVYSRYLADYIERLAKSR